MPNKILMRAIVETPESLKLSPTYKTVTPIWRGDSLSPKMLTMPNLRFLDAMNAEQFPYVQYSAGHLSL